MADWRTCCRPYPCSWSVSIACQGVSPLNPRAEDLKTVAIGGWTLAHTCIPKQYSC